MLISIVAPFYNEEGLIQEYCSRVADVMDGFCTRSSLKAHDLSWEAVLVNDGSSDNSLDIVLRVRQGDPHFKVLDLSRNFGHQIAITAGIEHAKGDVVVIMDSDLQDPPEVIPLLLEKMFREGLDVVYAIRKKRKGEGLFKRATAALFYRFFRMMTGISLPLDTGDFRAMKRPVVDALMRCRERHRFVRGLVYWTGFRQGGLYYEREPRKAGETKYPLIKMLRFSMDAITAFSLLPLRLASLCGCAAAIIGGIYGIYALYQHFVAGSTIKGWTSTVVLILFMGGIQLISLGIIGEYIGRIVEEVKQRPLYIVNKFYG